MAETPDAHDHADERSRRCKSCGHGLMVSTLEAAVDAPLGGDEAAARIPIRTTEDRCRCRGTRSRGLRATERQRSRPIARGKTR